MKSKSALKLEIDAVDAARSTVGAVRRRRRGVTETAFLLSL